MPPNTRGTRILDIGTAVPDHRCTREQSLAIARRILADSRAVAFVERVVEGSEIDCRHTVIAGHEIPLQERTLPPNSADGRSEATTSFRNQIFEREAPVLAFAACQALSPPAWRSRVTHLVTATCTGLTAPGFDVALMKALDLSPRVERTQIAFMGCYAGFSTLKMARHLCASDPSALVLVVHVELCSLHLQVCEDPEALVANCIFADGAAAALVGGECHADLVRGRPLTLLGSASWVLSEGLGDMTWSIGDHGFRMTLSRRVPHLVAKHLPNAFQTLLDETKVARDSIRHWAVHPGGAAILHAAEKALTLGPDDLAVARNLLRSHGNMSSATLWFLLDRIRRQPASGLVYACGFGPGLTLESALLGHPGG